MEETKISLSLYLNGNLSYEEDRHMPKRALTLCLLIVLTDALTACGPRNKPDPTPLPYTPQVRNTATPNIKIIGDPEAGAIVFKQSCSSCHSLEQGVNIAGPSLFQAGERMTYNYIKQSITNPHEVVVVVTNPEFQESVMPSNFLEIMTQQETEDVIEYLLSMKVISPTSASPHG